MENFKKRWNITTNWQAFVIIVVFAITGSTAAIIAKPILAFLGITKETMSLWFYYPLYVLMIFPVYQVLLVSFGYIFGQFNFFWAFEKKMLHSMKLGFIANYFDSFLNK